MLEQVLKISLLKSLIESSTLSLQTAWTGFDLIHIAVGHPQQAPACWKVHSNCKIFYTQQGHCDRHSACHAPGAKMALAWFPGPTSPLLSY